MNTFFKPKSIALVGASARKDSVSYGILNNLIKNNYPGKIFAINPKDQNILGLKTKPNLKSIQEKVDLVIIVIPADKVISILEEMALLQLKSAIIISSGFIEVGNNVLQQKLVKICQDNNIQVIGPNCLGIINPYFNLNASFAGAYPMKGKIAFISQSGAICTGLIDLANSLKIGFSKFISLGNKAIIDEACLINYLAEDKETDIIAIYTEQLRDSKRIIEACKKFNKPIIILKGGVSQLGASASASHTGALVANTGAYKALVEQANLIEVDNVSQLLNYLAFFQAHLGSKANDLVILGNAGGPGVLAADQVERKGLNLKILNSLSSLNLAKEMPLNSSLNNPVDILGDATVERYSQAFKILQKHETKASFLVIISPQTMSDVLAIAKSLVDIKKNNIFLSFVLLGDKLVLKAKEFLRNKNISVFTCPKEAIDCFYAYYKWQKKRNDLAVNTLITLNPNKTLAQKIIKASENKIIREDLAFKIFKAYQIPVVKNYFATSAKEVKEITSRFSSNLALKISSPNIVHKSDASGIKLNVSTDNIEQEYLALNKEVLRKRPRAQIEGVLISEMIKSKHLELIVGAFADPLLGNIFVFGLGGIYVEFLKDQSFGLEPLTYQQALNMVNSLKISQIFDGARTNKSYNKKELALVILKVRQLMLDFKEIKEIDINPLFAFAGNRKPLAIDARIILK